MKKLILFITILMVFVFLAGTFLHTDRNEDRAVQAFIKDFDQLTEQVVQTLIRTDPNQSEIQKLDRAKWLIDQKKSSLQTAFRSFKALGNVQVTPVTARALDESFENNFHKIRLIYDAFFQKVTNDRNALNQAKEKHLANSSYETLREIETQTRKLEQNVEILNKMQALTNEFKEIIK